MKERTKVLLVEDSPTAGALLMATLKSDPSIEVVGWAKDGREAISLTEKNTPDVISMDVIMPSMDGLKATEEIMSQIPTPIVIMSELHNSKSSDISMLALGAGAMTVLGKLSDPAIDTPQALQYLKTLKLMGDVKVVTRKNNLREKIGARSIQPALATRPFDLNLLKRADIIGIGASTGGPQALQKIFCNLPQYIDVPILLVQHLGSGFMRSFATWLSTTTTLRVKVAEQGEVLEPGTIYVADEDRHLGIFRTSHSLTALLSNAPIKNGFRPSTDLLFQSLAEVLGNKSLGIVLSGMGSDGAAGAIDIKRAGGHILAQNEESCIVYGMPCVVANQGLVDWVAPPEEIGDLLAQQFGESGFKKPA